MLKKFLSLVSLVTLLSWPVATRAGFELDSRKLWPILPSGQVQGLILEYHLIETPPPDAKYPDLYVTPETFSKHMAVLREIGLKCISFDDALTQLEAGNFDTSNIILTYDDGYRDNFNVAKNLSALGYGATFYIPTFYPGRSYPATHLFYMTWDDIRQVSNLGFEIGSHSVHHINLQNCKPDRAEYEISESINQIYNQIGKKPTTFSIPMGKYTNQVIVEIEKYGLRGCVTSNYGYLTNYNTNNAPRIKIVENTSMRSVVLLYLLRNLKLEGDIRPNTKSPRVRTFRTMLARLGYPLTDSDVYDAEMTKAVKAFQKYFQLQESGELNSVTMDRIVSDFIALAVTGI